MRYRWHLVLSKSVRPESRRTPDMWTLQDPDGYSPRSKILPRKVFYDLCIMVPSAHPYYKITLKSPFFHRIAKSATGFRSNTICNHSGLVNFTGTNQSLPIAIDLWTRGGSAEHWSHSAINLPGLSLLVSSVACSLKWLKWTRTCLLLSLRRVKSRKSTRRNRQSYYITITLTLLG